MQQMAPWLVTWQKQTPRDQPIAELVCPGCQMPYRAGQRFCKTCDALPDGGNTTVVMVGAVNPDRKPNPAGNVFIAEHRALFFEIDGVSLPLPQGETLTVGRWSTQPQDVQPEVDL